MHATLTFNTLTRAKVTVPVQLLRHITPTINLTAIQESSTTAEMLVYAGEALQNTADLVAAALQGGSSLSAEAEGWACKGHRLVLGPTASQRSALVQNGDGVVGLGGQWQPMSREVVGLDGYVESSPSTGSDGEISPMEELCVEAVGFEMVRRGRERGEGYLEAVLVKKVVDGCGEMRLLFNARFVDE